MVVLSSMAVVAATPHVLNTPDVNSSGYSTYIVAFKDGPSVQAENQVTDLVNSFNGNIIYRYSVIDGMAVTIPDDKVGELKALDNVKYVEKDQTCQVLLDKAVPQIGGDKAWAAGYTGKGIKVAVVDTGVDASHPDLDGSKVIAWVDYVNGKTTPYDDHGHGTHVSSTIAGTGNASGGKYRGVAPDASLMVAKVLSGQGSGSDTNIIKGIDWAVQNGAQVISLSLGSNQHDQAIDDAVSGAVQKGVVMVVAAGNSGPNARTIASPGDDVDVITVGASDRNDTIASFSSRGPNYDGSVKPDVTNMGVGLWAAKATGTNPTKGTQYYLPMSGTSMATPMTSGVVALLLQANHSLSPAQVKLALEKTAKPLGGSVPNDNYGYGRVDARAALDYVLNGTVPAPTPTPSPSPGPSPTPTPTPGGYAVSLAAMYASYNGQYGQMSQFLVKPGTTITQALILYNMGSSADSYSVAVNGIPATWYQTSGYDGSTLQPNQASYLTVQIMPSANASAGAYNFTVTATSNSDSTVTATGQFTLNVASATPVTPPVTGGQFSGSASWGHEYYTYLTPGNAGQVTATVSSQSSSGGLSVYLYGPSGKLVAESDSSYAAVKTVQYNATTGGYYMMKVTSSAYNAVSFTGTASVNVQQAYVNSGSINPGRPVTVAVNASGAKRINARLAWTWSYDTVTLSAYDHSGKKLAQGTRTADGTNGAYEQIDFLPPAAGTYTLKLDSGDTSRAISYKLITPFRL